MCSSDLFFRKPLHNHAAEHIVEEKLDDIALADRGRRFHPLTVDLHVPAAAGLRRFASMLEKADELEPCVDAVPFAHDRL